MSLGISLLGAGVLFLLIGLVCWVSGIRQGLPIRVIGGLSAVALSGAGVFFLMWEDRSDRERDDLLGLHRTTVKNFSERNGFGENRMPVRPRMSVESQDVYRVFQTDLDQNASDIHVEDRDFLTSRESNGPKPGEKTRWTVRKVQLVGLTKHPNPVVYLTDILPKMDTVAETPTREMDEFETQALLLIRRGQELHTKADGNLIRMMAPIFAASNCVKCHEPQGKLLGAFSYEVERETGPAGSGS
jgi:hypothetical protein